MNSSILIDEILAIEWRMFTALRSSNAAPCQKRPQSFQDIRASLFETWPDRLLCAYLNDLMNARQQGTNLVRDKYARMDQLIPSPVNPEIERIIEIETRWQQAVERDYPKIAQRCCRTVRHEGQQTDFGTYLRGELHGYSKETLQCYRAHIHSAQQHGINLAHKALEILLKRYGYGSLAEAEALW